MHAHSLYGTLEPLAGLNSVKQRQATTKLDKAKKCSIYVPSPLPAQGHRPGGWIRSSAVPTILPQGKARDGLNFTELWAPHGGHGQQRGGKPAPAHPQHAPPH
jgi:hypothetical protein